MRGHIGGSRSRGPRRLCGRRRSALFRAGPALDPGAARRGGGKGRGAGGIPSGLRAWSGFDGTDTRAWLHTIGLRLAFNRLRRRRLWDRWLRGQRPDPDWVIPERIDLWRALGELKPQQRAALLLNVVDGYTQAEVARMLEAPEGTVASWVSEAKRRLRGILGEEALP